MPQVAIGGQLGRALIEDNMSTVEPSVATDECTCRWHLSEVKVPRHGAAKRLVRVGIVGCPVHDRSDVPPHHIWHEPIASP